MRLDVPTLVIFMNDSEPSPLVSCSLRQEDDDNTEKHPQSSFRALTHLRFRLQRPLLITFTKRPHTPLPIAGLDPGQQHPPERILAQHGPPPLGLAIHAPPELRQRRRIGLPQTTAHEACARLAVHVVTGIRALAAGAREGRTVVGLIGRGVFVEADVAVDTEDDVFGGQLGDGGVEGGDVGGEGGDIGGEVDEGAAVLFVVC